MACTHTKSCDLFAQFAFNPTLKVWQNHYCAAEYARCARYQAALRGEAVPLNLLPNGQQIATPRSETAYGATALFNAIAKGRTPMVESLLKAKIDANARGPDGTTPLIAAATVGNGAIVALLLKHGADVALRNRADQTAAEAALTAGHRDIAASLAKREPTAQTVDAKSKRFQFFGKGK